MGNYRPISILPTISKIYETVIQTRLMNYLQKFEILEQTQHGFLKNKSTITAITELLEYVANAFDRGEEVMLSCCDLGKAFDCVDHKILLNKLEMYGIRGTAYKLLTSYLEERWQVVTYAGQKSNRVLMTRGVPQGSILGPLLFLVYVNDISFNISGAEVVMYADDTTLMVQGKDRQKLKEDAECAIGEAGEWFRSNGLKLNNNKTQQILLTTKREAITIQHVRFLGVHISTRLGWDHHVALLRKHLATSIFTIRQLMRTATYEAARVAYFANFQSRASYGIIAWGASTAAEDVFLLQKEAVRALSRVPARTSCKRLFGEHRIITIPGLFILSCLLYVKRSTDLEKHADIHNYGTRNRQDIVIPYHRLRTSQMATNYYAIRMYNKLPENIKNKSGADYERTLRLLLTECAFYSIQDFFNHQF